VSKLAAVLDDAWAGDETLRREIYCMLASDELCEASSIVQRLVVFQIYRKARRITL